MIKDPFFLASERVQMNLKLVGLSNKYTFFFLEYSTRLFAGDTQFLRISSKNFGGPTASASFESLEKMENLRTYSRPTVLESAFQQNSLGVLYSHIKFEKQVVSSRGPYFKLNMGWPSGSLCTH